MRTHFYNSLSHLGFLSFIFCLFFVTCTSDQEVFAPEIKSDYLDSENWLSLFETLKDEQNLFVTQGGSIQEAIDAAKPGDKILIEGGIYSQNIVIEQSDLQLIGIPGPGGSMVTLTDNVMADINNAALINIEAPKLGDWTYLSLDNLDLRSNTGRARRFSKEKLDGGVVHYYFDLKLGGDNDLVRLHRVVKEQPNGKTGPTDGAVFMIHGASQDFEDIFLYPGSIDANVQTSCPVYLAANGLDVWGIDLGWTKIPGEISDFTFMQDWGLQKDVDHTMKAMVMARLIRGLTGQGFGKINLLGFSYGAFVAYAAASEETQELEVFRSIKGLIPVDQGIKFSDDDEASRINSCNEVATNRDLLQSGIYQANNGQIFAGLGLLAQTNPDGDSPFVPGLTNLQGILFFGSNTYLLQNIPGKFWHFVGGDIADFTDVPSDFLYTQTDRWISLVVGLPPYQPVRVGLDVSSCLCNEQDVSFDDHLKQITLPIFYLGAAGGTGSSGEYTLTLTSSTDINTHIISKETYENRFRDFGHGDLFMADEASSLVWEPLAQWLTMHGD